MKILLNPGLLALAGVLALQGCPSPNTDDAGDVVSTDVATDTNHPADAGADVPVDVANDVSAATPTIAISSPADGANVPVPADHLIAVQFSTTNFTLMAPGSCAGMANCGHVHLLVDGNACNASGSPYNNAGAASPINADLSHCTMEPGAHVITLELHNDDHSAVMSGGAVVSATTHITVGSSGPPSIVIQSPTTDEVVLLPSSNNVPVSFHVSGFTLAAPGSCAGMANCGHVHLLIDDAGCNASGSPYNNAGAASPIDANFGVCATASGAHVIALELHNDDHSPVLVAGTPVRATVAVNATSSATAPRIVITSPFNGATVTPSAAHTFPVAFTTANFTLMAPGSCASAANCGHVHLLVDGTACGTPYNAAGAASPIDANLATCPMTSGHHTVRIELHDDTHAAVQVNGATVASAVDVSVP